MHNTIYFKGFQLMSNYLFELLNKNKCSIFSNHNWWVCWEDNHEFICEKIKFSQSGCKMKINNLIVNPPNGKWESKLKYDNDSLIGSYNSIEESRNKGALYLNANNDMNELLGRWIGCSNHGINETGFVLLKILAKKDDEILKKVLSDYIMENK